MGWTWPATQDRVAAPPVACTRPDSDEGRPISTPCVMSYRVTPSALARPVATSATPSPTAADPVAGSSVTETPGTNTRERTWSASPEEPRETAADTAKALRAIGLAQELLVKYTYSERPANR